MVEGVQQGPVLVGTFFTEGGVHSSKEVKGFTWVLRNNCTAQEPRCSHTALVLARLKWCWAEECK